MTERSEKLEAELAAMKPREMSAKLVNEISAQLAASPRVSWADRCLIGAMSMGSLAACVIIGIVLFDVSSNSSPGSVAVTRVEAPASSPRMGDLAMARADSPHSSTWVDRLK